MRPPDRCDFERMDTELRFAARTSGPMALEHWYQSLVGRRVRGSIVNLKGKHIEFPTKLQNPYRRIWVLLPNPDP